MKITKLKIILLSIVFMFFGISGASATYMADITYDYVDNGGGNYTFTYTVNNISDGSDTGGLDYFEISFDADAGLTNYDNLTWTNGKGWWTDAADSDDSFGALPGFVLADDSIFGSGGGGIAQGASVAGFSVKFDYSGALLPDEQLFTWYAEFGTSDVDNGGIPIDVEPDGTIDWWVLGQADGTIRYVPGQQNPIPEPASMILLGTGLAGLLGFGRKKKLLKG